MKDPAKVMFLANWAHSKKAQAGGDYAFFRHFDKPVNLKFFGTFDLPLITNFEKRFLHFYLLQPLVAFFLSFRYDLIIAYSAQSALPLAFLFRIFRRSNPPMILFDVETFGRPRGGLRLWLTRFVLPAITHIIFASSGQKKFYQQYLPAVLEKSTHIPIGIGEYEKTTLDERTDGPTIVAVGKHDHHFRDWKTLLLAFAPLADRAKLVIVGRPTIDEIDRGGAPIPPNVEFRNYMPIDELGRVVAGARFAVLPLPERDQSLGQLSILFLMAMGKAVISSRVIGVEDYLEDGVTGLFYSPGNPSELTRTIEKLLDDPQQAEAMGKAGRDAVLEKFNDKVMGKAWEKVVDQVLGRENEE